MIPHLLPLIFAGHGAPAQAEAIDFDGANDYLSRASDLVGNADGKTFTFSAWVYSELPRTEHLYSGTVSSTDGLELFLSSTSGTLYVAARNGSSTVLVGYTAAGAIPKDTWSHILVSVDMANTANRSIYINDVPVGVTWPQYSNNNINFSTTAHTIAANITASSKLKGRLAHVYLDYSYLDLSIEANRRLFIEPL